MVSSDSHQAQTEQNKLQVFISYNRKEEPFVRALSSALEQRNIDTWVDLNRDDDAGLNPGDPWAEQLRSAIAGADVFLVVATQHYMNSEVCNQELALARQQRMKMLVVLRSENFLDATFKDQIIGKSYGELAKENSSGVIDSFEQWDFLRSIHIEPRNLITQDELPAHIDRLVDIIRTDYNLIKWHTALTRRAAEWRKQLEAENVDSGVNGLPGQAESQLLRGAELDSVIAWRGEVLEQYSPNNVRKMISIGVELNQYIDASIENRDAERAQAAREEQKRQTRWNRFIRGALIIVALLAVAAIVAAIEADEQAGIARDERDRANTERDRAEENAEDLNDQLQTFVLDNEIAFWPLERRATVPVILENQVWFGERGSTAIQPRWVDNGDVANAPITVSESVLPPVSDGRFVWVASVTDRLLSRIDPQTYDAFQVELPYEPQEIIFVSSYVWIRAENGFIQLDAGTLQILNVVDVGSNIFQVSVGSNHLWTVEGRTQDVVAINAQDATMQRVAGIGASEAPIVYHSEQGDVVWQVMGTSLAQWQAEPLQTQVTIPFEGQLQQVAIGEGRLWVLGKIGDSQVIYQLDPYSGETIQQVAVTLPTEANQLYEVAGRLWVLTGGRSVGVYVAESLEPLRVVELADSSDLTTPVLADRLLWFTNRDSQVIYAFDVTDGELVRRLPLCNNPTTPVFDGVYLWVSCRDIENPQIARIPGYLYYHGVGDIQEIAEYRNNSRPHIPIWDGDRLWMVQEAEGWLVVFDPKQGCTIGSLNLGTYPIELYFDGRYVWASLETEVPEYALLRFDTLNESALSVCDAGQLQPDDRLPYPNEITKVQPVEDTIWIYYFTEPVSQATPAAASLDETQSLLGLQILDTDLNVLEPIDWGQTRSLAIVDVIFDEGSNHWWAVTNGVTSSTFYQLDYDASTLQFKVVNSYEVPYMASVPVIHDGVLWFSSLFDGGLGSLNDLQVLGGDGAGSIVGVDLATNEVVTDYRLDGSPYPLIEAGEYLWFTQSTDTPAMFIMPDRRQDANAMVFSPRTREIVETFTPCVGMRQPFYDSAHHHIWLTCLGSGGAPGDVQVIDTESLEEVIYHRDLGEVAWDPIIIDDEVWIVYRGSSTAVVFDIESGEIVERYKFSNSPSPPVLDTLGNFWIMNSGNGTLQKVEQ